MKKGLRILALIVAFAAVGTWFFSGANLGWTKNKVAVKTVDEVTGIEGVTFQDKFVPGVDFAAAGLGAGFVLLAISFAFKTKKTKSKTP